MAINFCPDAAQRSVQAQNSAEHAVLPCGKPATSQAKPIPLKQPLHQLAPKLPLQRRRPPLQPQRVL